jgi:molybdopterin-guanine dinucleotide biosynthesis adapter protein
MTRVAAFSGPSGSGKTTLIERVIPLLIARYGMVGAIKHTHHAINDENRGDTARFGAAGADPVILAGDYEAVSFRHGVPTDRFAWSGPAELVARLATDIVIVEGFKHADLWPRIELDATRRIEAAEAVAILDRIWRS